MAIMPWISLLIPLTSRPFEEICHWVFKTARIDSESDESSEHSHAVYS